MWRTHSKREDTLSHTEAWSPELGAFLAGFSEDLASEMARGECFLRKGLWAQKHECVFALVLKGTQLGTRRGLKGAWALGYGVCPKVYTGL